jgi:hypothetical protein
MSSAHELAGYSGTPLPRKLGIKPDHRVALIDAPAGFKSVLEPLPDGVKVVNAARLKLDVILLFVVRRDELERPSAESDPGAHRGWRPLGRLAQAELRCRHRYQ